MTLTNAGSIGIGTTTPVNKLTVTGEGTGVAQLGAAGCGGNYVGLTLGQTTPANCGNYNILSSPSDTSIYLNRPAGATMRFRENNADQMVISSGGNVGIGTTTPPQKLTVAGMSEVMGFKMPTGATSNYVLTSDANGVASWQPLPPCPAPVLPPSGAVMFFNLASCPPGWTELASAQGRYIVGLPSEGTLAGTDGTALTNLEDRPVGQHTHPIYTAGGNGYTCSGLRTVVDAFCPWTGWTTNYIQTTGAVAGTNAPYIQLLACQKD